MNRKMMLGMVLLLTVAAGKVCAAAPDITLKDTTGISKTFAELTGGKRAALFFWASWCHFCRNELEKLPEQAEFIKNNGIEVIGINIGESADEAKKYKEQSGFSFPVFLDEEQRLAQHFGILGIPTFIYFADGKEVGRNNYFIPKKVDQIFNLKPSAAAPDKSSRKVLKK
jgi:thiol-disulfide isomerase/thioredoxin